MDKKYSREEIVCAVYNILETEFEIDKTMLKEEADLFQDLDLDSIDLVDLAVRLQKYTDKRLSPEEFKKIKTVKDIADTLYAMV